jgi:DNA mismatch repair protein MSH3
MAIASAVLQHIVQKIKCKTLFVTHYPLVAKELEKRFPRQVQNLHMGYTEDTRIDGSREITFLYRLTQGITTESFGVECGRLAGLPESILQLAAEKAQTLGASVESRTKRKKSVLGSFHKLLLTTSRLLYCATILQESLQSGNGATLDELKEIINSISTSE